MSETITFEEFKKVDLRVATVKQVEPHPNADKLYVLTIDVGGKEKRIVAGVRQYYAPGELVGRKIVVVDNLQPSVIRGIESQGMLLAAKDASTLAILVPEKDVGAGSAVS